MSSARWCVLLVTLAAVPAAAPVPAGAGDDIDPALLAIKDCPGEPGCSALVVLDQTELSNEKLQARVSHHRLIKVFTDEGIMKYSDLVVAAVVGDDNIRNLSGRTILPDGRTIPLKNEDVSVKTAYRRGRILVRQKKARFTGVVAGSIIDYSYDLISPKAASYRRWTWDLQEEMPVLDAKLTLRPGPVELTWMQTGIEKGVLAHTVPHKSIHDFSLSNIPAAPDEPFAPPDRSVRGRVHFFDAQTASVWMARLGASVSMRTGEFLAETAGIPEKVRSLIAAGDKDSARVEKIYKFVQQEIGTEESRVAESEADKVKDAKNVGEVMARGYGNEYERTMLFLAMAKEAGLGMGVLIIAGRDNAILNPDVPDPEQFDSYAATVKTGENWTFYDPAVRHCPFGMLSAEKEGVSPNAIIVTPERVDPDRRFGTLGFDGWFPVFQGSLAPVRLVKVPGSPAAKNVLLRVADVALAEDGSVVVDGTDQGSGQVDLEHRRDYENVAEDARRGKFGENLRHLIPRADLRTVSFEEIASFEKPATVHYTFDVPGAAAKVGDRLVLSPSLFHRDEPALLTAATRRTPVNLPHTLKTMERLTIHLPPGYEAVELPAPVRLQVDSLVLTTDCWKTDEGLVFSRRVEIDPPYWSLDDYPRLRAFLERVQEADHQVVVLARNDPAS